jgi:hypothetical protein
MLEDARARIDYVEADWDQPLVTRQGTSGLQRGTQQFAFPRSYVLAAPAAAAEERDHD